MPLSCLRALQVEHRQHALQDVQRLLVLLEQRLQAREKDGDQCSQALWRPGVEHVNRGGRAHEARKPTCTRRVAASRAP